MEYYAKEDEDRLSSLPNPLIIDILSRIPFKTAVATSVLSHRWRRLWTQLRRIKATISKTPQSAIMFDRILQQLSSPKLHEFHLHLQYGVSFLRTIDFLYPLWFRQFRRRKVENVTVLTAYESPFSIPAFVFNSKSLVSLKLWGSLKFNCPKIRGLRLRFYLPNLKELTLHHVHDFPVWLETLISSCPLLEDLSLVCKLHSYSESSCSKVANIIAPNLKSLFICMESFPLNKKLGTTRVSIDAPKLSNLEIHDCFSIYNFLRNPTTLANARIDLKNERGYTKESAHVYEEDDSLIRRENYLSQMTKFVGGLSSVANLELKLEDQTNVFKYRNPVNVPIFHNLTRLETNCLRDLMCYLHCFPNLEHLEVCLRFDNHIMEEGSWSAPEFIPDCLVSKLKTIQIRGMKGTDDDLGILEYILINAFFLEKLVVDCCMVDGEGQFCTSLLKLRRSSSTCEVVVSGNYSKHQVNALRDE